MIQIMGSFKPSIFKRISIGLSYIFSNRDYPITDNIELSENDLYKLIDFYKYKDNIKEQ
jgi:hypothetical protein